MNKNMRAFRLSVGGQREKLKTETVKQLNSSMLGQDKKGISDDV